ncbi:MAG: phosphoribosylformylglycinamidine synthase subunit PurS [Candidatus Poribacteria bacterium]|nr:phosphoribosylformylglycinamidine synthase subunit PurS [Candidatus Poribacteria bacterium]
MKWKIEVSYKPDTPDALGEGLRQDIADFELARVESVHTAHIYWLQGDIDSHAIERICTEFLAEPVTQDFAYSASNSHVTGGSRRPPFSADSWTIEVRFKPGVTDAVGDSVLKGVRDLGISGVQSAQTGQKYWIEGNLDRSQLEMIAQRLLANEVIQTFEILAGDG